LTSSVFVLLTGLFACVYFLLYKLILRFLPLDQTWVCVIFILFKWFIIAYSYWFKIHISYFTFKHFCRIFGIIKLWSYFFLTLSLSFCLFGRYCKVNLSASDLAIHHHHHPI